MSKEKLINQLKNAYKQLEEEFKNKGRPNTIEDKNVDYDNCNIYAMRQKISDLEAKLAEKETRIAELEDKDWYEGIINQLEEQNERLIKERDSANDQNKRVLEKLDLIVRSNQELEKQLAEKEKAHMEAMENALNDFLTLRQELNQAKTDFAIEQLEKVKEYVDNLDTPCVESICNEYMCDIEDYIDNQIKELKG